MIRVPRNASLFAVSALTVATAAACGGSSPAPSSTSRATASARPAETTGAPNADLGAACSAAQLVLAWGGLVSEATGQHSLLLTLTNRSSAPCHLEGYPAVVLLDPRSKPLPFAYRDAGDQMLTASAPGTVEIAPGKVAYVMVDKYRCDLPGEIDAASVRVTVPGQQTALTLAWGRYPIIGYCGAGDSGSTVYIAPIEPTYPALLAH